MIDEKIVARMQTRLDEFRAKRGLAVPMPIEPMWDDEAYIYVSAKDDNAHAAEITEVFRDFVRHFTKVEDIIAVRPDPPEYGTEDPFYELPHEDDDYVRELWFEVKPGFFTHTAEDEAAIAAWEREAEEREAREEAEEEAQYQAERAVRLKRWKEFLLPIPPMPDKPTRDLYLPLSYEPYDAIERGEKTTEFRAYTPYWVKRIISNGIKTVRFQRGYGGPGREPPRQMQWTVKGVTLYEMATRAENDPFNPTTPMLPDFIAIDLGKRIE